ncbi:MAG: hypothetical protein RLZZ273_1230 [Bacteroidota bacterium]
MIRIPLLLTVFVILAGNSPVWAQYFEGKMRLTIRDSARNKDIPITIIYPADSSSGDNRPLVGTGTKSIPTFRVFIMGHGYQMPVTAYKSLATNICQNVGSYIVVLPETGSGLFPNHGDFALDMVAAGAYMQREHIRQGSLWNGHVADNTVMAGHSMGGGAAFLAAKEVIQKRSFNLNAVIGLAPAETNPSSSAAAAFVTCPTLILAGGVDCVTPLAGTVQPIYNNVASLCKTLATIPGASHCQFADANSACNLGELNCKATISRDAQFARSWQYINLLLRRSDGFASQIGDTEIQTTFRSVEARDIAFSRTQACAGDTIRCVYSGNATNLLWLPDSVRGATYSFVARSGTQRISLINTTCFGTTSIDTTVNVYDRPTVRIDGPSALCPSDSIVLRAVSNSAPGNIINVRWSTGDTSNSVVVRQPGIYTVRATSERGCGDASVSYVVDLVTTPNVSIRIIGDTVSCGELKPLEAQLIGDLDLVKEVRWNNGDTARRISIVKPGAYTLYATMRMRADAGCNVYTDTASFTVRTVAAQTPEVSFTNDTLWSTKADTYSWTFDGAPIAGATAAYHVPQRSGLYAVQTTRSEDWGCLGTSKAVRVTLSDIEELVQHKNTFIAKPGGLYVHTVKHSGSLTIYSSAGCVMHTMSMDVVDQPVRIDTSVFPAGVYAVVADGTWLGNFIVVR